ncbi:MAG: DNA translocase FtsK 4TM domain-containing protein [Planctomycetes bacterium]|nr:DNA translocase FtsK 4TM domain-containing protein [Planctomycetota bacterium]
MPTTGMEREQAATNAKAEKRVSASEMISLAVFGLSVFTLTGLLFYNPVEYFAREVTRHPREVPFLFARLLYSNLGLASYLIVVFAAIWSAVQFFREHVRAIGLKAFGIVLLGCSVATLAGSIAASGGDGARLESGGIVGTFLSERLQELVGPIGLYLVLLLFLGVSLIFVTDWFFVSFFRHAMPSLSWAGFGGMTPTLIAPVPDEDRHEALPPSAEEIFRTIETRRESTEAIVEETEADPDVDLSDMQVEVVSPEEPEAPTADRTSSRFVERETEAPPADPTSSRFVERETEPPPPPAAEIELPRRRFEARDARTETDEEREIEVDPEHLVFDDDDENGPTQFIILDGDPEDSEWVENASAGPSTTANANADDDRSVAEILSEIAEPIAAGESDDEDEVGGIEVEIEPTEAAAPVVDAPPPKPVEPEPAVAETTTIREPEPEIEREDERKREFGRDEGVEVESDESQEAGNPIASAAFAPEPATASSTDLPADAERIEALTLELARERQRTESVHTADADANAAEIGGPREEALYKDAVRVVVESRRGSVSLLQRRLEVGYARATKFLERMEREGVVGPYEGAKARDVLVTLEEWEAFSA